MHVILYAPIRLQATSTELRLFSTNERNLMYLPYSQMTRDELQEAKQITHVHRVRAFRYRREYDHGGFFYDGCSFDGTLYSLWSLHGRRVFLRDFFFLVIAQSTCFIPLLSDVTQELITQRAAEADTADPLLARLYMNLNRTCPKQAVGQVVVDDL